MDLLDLLFPRRCVGCGKIKTYLCQDCQKKISFVENPVCPICERPSPYGLTHPRCQTPLVLDGVFVLARYRPPLSSAIQKFKYRYISDLTSTLSNLLIEKLRCWPILSTNYQLLTAQCLIVPIPLYPSRLRWRGFNQSELLAQKLSEQFNILINTKSLIRSKETTPQAKLKSRKDRKDNIRNAFRCVDKKAVLGKIVFLIDDLATTGETLKEAVKELKRNGAQKVYGIVLARGRS